jgi:hypothetical protein
VGDTLDVTLVVQTAGAGHQLKVSSASNRANANPLAGRTLSGNAFVFVDPALGINKVQFWLDDPGKTGSPDFIDKNAPWDLVKTNGDGTAAPLVTPGLLDGPHNVTAQITLTTKQNILVSANFIAENWP